MATGHRTKRTIKDRPKHRQERSLRTRRRKARLAASRKRSTNQAKARRAKRGSLRRLR